MFPEASSYKARLDQRIQNEGLADRDRGRKRLNDTVERLTSGEPITLNKLGSAIGAAGQGLEGPRAKCRLWVGMTSPNIAR